MLGHFVVQRRSIYFILDSDFDYYQQHAICVKFVTDTFAELNESDSFALEVLGKPIYSLKLERKAKNKHLKLQILD